MALTHSGPTSEESLGCSSNIAHKQTRPAFLHLCVKAHLNHCQ